MSIHQETVIKCSQQRVYDALSKSDLFSAFTGEPAEIDFTAGGEFSCFDGMILGRTLEYTPSRMIVQAWRVANWDGGDYSIAKFQIEKVDEDTTKIILDHVGYPEQHQSHLEPGWHSKYWEPLKDYLEK